MFATVALALSACNGVPSAQGVPHFTRKQAECLALAEARADLTIARCEGSPAEFLPCADRALDGQLAESLACFPEAL